MTDWGADVENAKLGGFIVEKSNYYYYINGVGVSSSDNSFGTPVKGSLMAVDKTDFTKTEIVVPKLFVASDYKAGLYIFGDYVYYGTPNTDKDSSGEIAYTEMNFMKSKLDGTENTKLFTLSSLSAEYRIVQKDNVVYIVYYDSADKALEVYNCSTGDTSTIAKTDDKVGGANAESLNAYKFAESGSEVVVYFTTTVYAEDYMANKTDARATANYNKVYAYKAGDDVSGEITTQTAILDGSTKTSNPATYEIKLIKLGVLFYTETINAQATTYMLGYNDKITNTDVLADTTLFTETGLYTLTEGVIARADITDKNMSLPLAKAEGATALLAKNGNYVYFTDADTGISRIDITKGEDAKIEKVSSDVAYTGWYPIQFIGNYMFYCDSSSEGASYIKYVDVTGTVYEEDTDDDGEMDKFYLKGQTFMGQMTEEDQVSVATAKVNSIANALENGVIAYKKDANGVFVKDENGNLIFEKLAEVEDAIKNVELTEEAQELLDTYKKALEMASLYAKLEGIRNDVNQASYETAYIEVKGQIEEFRKDVEKYNKISAYIGNNMLWNYDKAVELFGE